MLLFYLTKIKKLQKRFAIFWVKLSLYKKALFGKKTINLNTIHCYGDRQNSQWVDYIKNRSSLNIENLTADDASFLSITRNVFNSPTIPKYICILFPEITCVETYDEENNNYIPVYLPQLTKKNISFIKNVVLANKFTKKFKLFLWMYNHETIVNNFIHNLKLIQQYCITNSIDLYFILPSFFLSKIAPIFERIMNCKIVFYNPKSESYNKIGNFFLDKING